MSYPLNDPNFQHSQPTFDLYQQKPEAKLKRTHSSLNLLSGVKSKSIESPRKKPRIKKEDVFEVMDQAKSMERNALINAYKGAKKLVQTSFNKLKLSKTALPSFWAIKRTAAHRQLLRLHTQAGKPPPTDEEIMAFFKEVSQHPIAASQINQYIQDKFPALDKNIASRMAKELAALMKTNSNTLSIQYKELRQQVLEIGVKLEQTPIDQRQYHIDLLKSIRQALNNPAYQAIKYDESNPCVQILHELCHAQYNNTAAIEAYEHIGKELIKKFELQNKKQDEQIDSLWHDLIESGIPATNVGVIFSRTRAFFSEIGQAIHASLSNAPVFLHLPRIFGSLFPREDHRTVYENNPGALYTETLKTGKGGSKEARAHTVYTPTPVLGFEAAPEFEAVLQSMENQRLKPEERADKGNPPSIGWVYTNLQDITSTMENPQSLELMRLQQKYPLSLFSITIAQDTAIMAGKDYENTNLLEAGDELFKSLTKNENFTHENRKKAKGGAYYFPIPAGTKRDEWNKGVKKIVDDALIIAMEAREASQKQGETLDNETFLRGFRELAHQGIMQYFQRMAIDLIAQDPGTPDKFDINSSWICRSGMDRGGKQNAEQIWALDSNTSPTLVTGTTFARALLSRRRPLELKHMVKIRDKVKTFALIREKVSQFLGSIQYGDTRSEGIVLTHEDHLAAKKKREPYVPPIYMIDSF